MNRVLGIFGAAGLAAVIGVFAFTGAGGGGGGGGGGGTPGTAHVFLATTGSDTCTRNTLAVNYTTAQADGNVCATFNGAYAVAQQGDAVLVEGTASTPYPSQAISYDATKTATNGACDLTYNGDGSFATNATGCVTFTPDTGQSPVVGCKTTLNGATPNPFTNSFTVTDATGCLPNAGTSTYTLDMRDSFNCTTLSGNTFSGCNPTSSGSTCGPYQDTTGQNALCYYQNGATITDGDLTLAGASFIRLQNITISGEGTIPTTGGHTVTNVIFDGVTMTGGGCGSCNTNGWGGNDVWFENGVTGNSNDNSGRFLFPVSTAPKGVINSTNYDVTQSGCNDPHDVYCHASNVYGTGLSNFYYVSNSNYGACGTGNFFLSKDNNVGSPGPIWIVNNYFGNEQSGCSGGTVFKLNFNGSTAFTGYHIEGNSFAAPISYTESGTNTLASSDVEGNLNAGFKCSDSFFSSYGVNIAYNVDFGTACTAPQSPGTASGNVGGQSFAGVFSNALAGDLDLINGPYVWENTWASCPLKVDHNGTNRPATCTPGGDQR